MQKEIKKRAQIYAVAAVLLAMVLGTLCYNLGVIPQEHGSPSSGFLRTFASYEELRSFLAANSGTQGPFPFLGQWDVRFMGPLVQGFAETAESLKIYSTTNIQVEGVDEADIVKTDGEHLYLVSGSNVFILKAYPAEEAEVLSKLTFNDTYLVGIFVNMNGDRLAVLGCRYLFPSLDYYRSFVVDVKTFVNVYDISNKTNPASLTNFTISGSYFSSRMIGDYVYFVVSQPAYVIYDTVILPKIYLKDGIKEIRASEIHYSNISDEYYQYTTIVALNMQDTAEEPTYETIMMGGTSSMYVSLNNIYVTFPELDGNTTIYRLRIENNVINPEAKGTVQGRELNQFSMDEYDNHFRIATTKWVNGTPQNNLYILDTNLSLVGRLEDFAPPGETMDSARFIGNRCYLSTSTPRKDPFFVIDVENASEPKILGNLSIPGFTRYLHPYDEDHVIGIGIDGGNVKITLFDVSDVSAPINMSEYKIESAWSNTPALTQHKAFLFDELKDLLAIPVEIQYYGLDKYSLWQGVYVFNITLIDGLILRGNVTHQESTEYWDYGCWVERALYIENVLYTVSAKKVKMNSLEDLGEINEVQLS